MSSLKEVILACIQTLSPKMETLPQFGHFVIEFSVLESYYCQQNQFFGNCSAVYQRFLFFLFYVIVPDSKMAGRNHQVVYVWSIIETTQLPEAIEPRNKFKLSG